MRGIFESWNNSEIEQCLTTCWLESKWDKMAHGSSYGPQLGLLTVHFPQPILPFILTRQEELSAVSWSRVLRIVKYTRGQVGIGSQSCNMPRKLVYLVYLLYESRPQHSFMDFVVSRLFQQSFRVFEHFLCFSWCCEKSRSLMSNSAESSSRQAPVIKDPSHGVWDQTITGAMGR